MTFPGICSSLIQSKRERYFVSYTISIWAYFRIGINLAVNRVNFLHRNWERSSYQGHPVFFFCSFEVPLTSFKLFLISRIRNLFGTAAKKYSIVSLPPPKRKKRYRAAFEFDKNTFNTQGLWFFSLLYPDSHAYTFLCKVNKDNGQHKIKLYQFVRRVNWLQSRKSRGLYIRVMNNETYIVQCHVIEERASFRWLTSCRW